MAKDKPTHDAFVAVTPNGSTDPKDTVWLKVGAAWPHKDGEGYNIVLHAVPVGGKLVIRKPRQQEGGNA